MYIAERLHSLQLCTMGNNYHTGILQSNQCNH